MCVLPSSVVNNEHFLTKKDLQSSSWQHHHFPEFDLLTKMFLLTGLTYLFVAQCICFVSEAEISAAIVS